MEWAYSTSTGFSWFANHHELRAGIDLSFTHVIAPAAIKLLEIADKSVLLNVGSGTGHFTALLSERAGIVVGIEPSSTSVDIARIVCANQSNVRFFQTTVEDFGTPLDRPATAAVALMVMMTAPDLDLFAKSVREVLAPGAAFVVVIPHPFFWPTYWGYASAPWFDYTKETFIEAPFAISGSKTDVLTTHIHRPLSRYFSALANAEFQLDAFDELMPTPEVEVRYPARWLFPRFMAIRWIRR
jgi:SAM-dependent methyltransferase